jgi:hypothetical protein
VHEISNSHDAGHSSARDQQEDTNQSPLMGQHFAAAIDRSLSTGAITPRSVRISDAVAHPPLRPASRARTISIAEILQHHQGRLMQSGQVARMTARQTSGPGPPEFAAPVCDAYGSASECPDRRQARSRRHVNGTDCEAARRCRH